MKTMTKILCGLMIVPAVNVAYADMANSIPSCYQANHYKFASAPYTKLAYVLLDQTVKLDPDLQKSVLENANRLLGPGTKFVVAQFSAFSEQRYLSVVKEGVIENPMTKDQRDNVPVKSLGAFDACMQGQAEFASKTVDNAINGSMAASTNDLSQSDIWLALKNVSSSIAADPAKQKVLFVITDGLENSSISSFYNKTTVRVINPAEEIAKARQNNMFGNFGGAKVYVLGAGTMPPAKAGSKAEVNGYRDPKTLQALQAFWSQYFQMSHAQLVEFGAPALVSPVGY